MKIIATAAATLFAAFTISTGTAHAEPAVNVNCSNGIQDLTTAQVMDQPPYHTPSTTSSIPNYYSVPPINSTVESPKLFVRVFEQLPTGFTAQQYVTQMQEKCVTRYSSDPSEQSAPLTRLFTEKYVVVILDTHGVADVAVGPKLGITRLMEPHIADFKKVAAAGNYREAVDSISQATRDEFNALIAAQVKLEPPRSIPCDRQETHDTPAPEPKSGTEQIFSGVTSSAWLIAAAVILVLLALLGLFALGAMIFYRPGDDIDEDNVVDAEVDEDEMRRFEER